MLADRGVLIAILAIALGLRVYFAFASDILPQHIDLLVQNKLAVDGGFEIFEAPLYPIFLRTIYMLFGKFNYRAVFMIQALLSFASAIIIYAAATKACGRRVGLITASLAALFPDFINYNQAISPITLTLFAVALIMLAAANGSRNKISACCSAVLFGIGILVYPPLLLFLPGFLVVTRKRFLFLIILIVVLTPWTIRNSVKAQRFIPVFDLYTFSIDTSRFLHADDGWAVVELAYFNATNLIGKRMNDQIENELLENRKYSRIMRAWVRLVLILMSLYGLIRYWNRNQLAVALPFIIYGLLILMTTFINSSSRLLIMPFWLLYASIAMTGGCPGREQLQL